MLLQPEMTGVASIRGNPGLDLSSYFLTRGQSLQQLKDSFVEPRVQHFRPNLRQRLKHKAPFLHRGMRYGQLRRSHDGIAEEQYVNVNRARPLFLPALATHCSLNPKDGRHQCLRRLRSFERHGTIQEPGLSGDLDRLGFVEGRDCRHASLRSQARDRISQMSFAITEVRRQRKIGSFWHGSTVSHFYTV